MAPAFRPRTTRPLPWGFRKATSMTWFRPSTTLASSSLPTSSPKQRWLRPGSMAAPRGAVGVAGTGAKPRAARTEPLFRVSAGGGYWSPARRCAPNHLVCGGNTSYTLYEEPLVFSCIPVELTSDWPKWALVERYFPETSADCSRNLTCSGGYGQLGRDARWLRIRSIDTPVPGRWSLGVHV